MSEQLTTVEQVNMPRTLHSKWEEALRVVLTEGDSRVKQVFAELDAERAVSAELLAALKAIYFDGDGVDAKLRAKAQAAIDKAEGTA